MDDSSKKDEGHADPIGEPPTTDDQHQSPRPREETESDEVKPHDPRKANPPYTTTSGWLTTPEFGAAGSGGAEYEPGPESD